MILDYDEFTKTIRPEDEPICGGDDCCSETPVMISEPEPTEVIPSVETPDSGLENLPVDNNVIIPTEDKNPPCGCENGQCFCCNTENLTIGEFFGTLMESVQIAWKYHLKATKHSSHVILEEYYDDAQDLIDTIIENYQGRYNIVTDFGNRICGCDMSDVEYFQELRTFLENGKMMFQEITSASELMSDIDALASLIDSTLYKLKNLTESLGYFKTLDEFINE